MNSMDNYISIVVDNDPKADDALHALWDLDSKGDITVHGAAVVHRDKWGYLNVATKETSSGLRTVLGIGIGALIGSLAGPVGAAAGASVAVGSAIGIGAAAGIAGLGGDLIKAADNDQAEFEAGFKLAPGKSAVIAEVSEESTTPVETLAQRVGGTVYRRSKGDIRKDGWDFDYGSYLYPYDYDPQFPA